jgi:hypothetical protein
MGLISLFIAYHVVALAVFNLPDAPLTRGLKHVVDRRLDVQAYVRATGNYQDWGLFAPEPARLNLFMRVVVETPHGELVDLGHDIHEGRRYPYLIYDRMGKVNRRLWQSEGYRSAYAAWVCRDWERLHGGEPVRAVRLTELATRIPPPEEAVTTMGFDPRALPVITGRTHVLPCAELAYGRLPSALRQRLGLPETPAPVASAPLQTWWTARQGVPAGRAGAPRGDAAEAGGRLIE